MYSLEEIGDFNDKFGKGEDMTLDYVKDMIQYILNNENIIKENLRKLKVAELKKMISDSRYTRKDEIVDHIYSSQVDNIYYFISGEDSIMITIDFNASSIKQQMSNKINTAFVQLTEERLKDLLKGRKEKYEVYREKIKRLKESIKNPETLQDFESARRMRKLTIEEQRTYEELKASEEKEKLKEQEVKLTQKVISNGTYSIKKTKDTRDNRDLWVVKFEEKSDDFKSLNRQMKNLGGAGYSRFTRGFNFYFDPSEKLEDIFKTEGTKEVNQNDKAAEKLKKVADNMQKEIDNKFADRLTNTARRANMAANAEREGEYLKNIQSIMYNVADIIESGKAKYLDKISARTHIQALEDILKGCKRKYISIKVKEKYPNENLSSNKAIQYEKELRNSSNILFDSIDVAEYPLTTCSKNFIKRLIEDTTTVSNTVMIRRRLNKLLKNDASEINTKNYTEDIIDLYSRGKQNGQFEYFNTSDIDNYKRLQSIDIKDTIMLRAALREYYNIREEIFEETEEDRKKKEIKEMQRSIIGVKIPGYFPTPQNIVGEMLQYADIKENDIILEPSAGSGHIADLIREKYPDNKLDVVEFNYSLSQILEKKGHNVIADDFLSVNLKENDNNDSIIVEGYDKIIMNPPFERNQDIEHVLHAFSLLKPGGKVVAIMSEHPFFASDKKSQKFREWLENQEESFSKKLPSGSFLESDRSTGVNARIVTVRKTEERILSLESEKELGFPGKVCNINEYVNSKKVDSKVIFEQLNMFSFI
ncbi:methyltransferase [Clostridium botulinum]|uniref:methyltransferase n=1 Tax=Clostridium botulinum TaxID=1491 RepID=UPI003DA2626A